MYDAISLVESGTNINSSAVKLMHYLPRGIKAMKKTVCTTRDQVHVTCCHQIFTRANKQKAFSEYFGFGNLDTGLETCNINYLLKIQKL